MLLSKEDKAVIEFFLKINESIECTKLVIEKYIDSIKKMEIEIDVLKFEILKNEVVLKEYEQLLEKLYNENERIIKIHKTYEGMENLGRDR